MFSSDKKIEKQQKQQSSSSLAWGLFKKTGLFIARQIPVAMQMASSALIFKYFIEANRTRIRAEMENLRDQVLNVDLKTRETLLKSISSEIEPMIEKLVRPVLDKHFESTKHLKQMAEIICELREDISSRSGLHLLNDKAGEELQELIKTIDVDLCSRVERDQIEIGERGMIVAEWSREISNVASREIAGEVISSTFNLDPTQASSFDVLNKRIHGAKKDGDKLDIIMEIDQKIRRNSSQIAQFCTDLWNKRMDDMDRCVHMVTGKEKRYFRVFKNVMNFGFFEYAINENSEYLSLMTFQFISNVQLISMVHEHGIGRPSWERSSSSRAHMLRGSGAHVGEEDYHHHRQLDFLPGSESGP